MSCRSSIGCSDVGHAAVAENADVAETVKLKETYGMRRVTVVDEAGGLVGVVSLADLQGVLSS